MNVARHKSRYSDLPPVDISNESFQRLVFKPRKKEAKGKSSKNAATASGGVAAEAPSIMDLYPVIMSLITLPVYHSGGCCKKIYVGKINSMYVGKILWNNSQNSIIMA